MELITSKALAMLALGLGSFIAGMLPAWFSPRARNKHPLLLSNLLCFGGGVLLATALVHMLPEAREQLPDYSEVTFCVGFLLVYFVDELVHLFYGKKIDKDSRTSSGSSTQPNVSYGSLETTGLLNQNQIYPNLGDQNADQGRNSPCPGDTESPRMCHVSHTEPCNKSATGRIGLLVALLLHSLLEGLAIGLQGTTAKVLILLSAVASHKFVVAFCLGIELAESCAGRICAHIVSILIFSSGSVLGIALGAGLDDIQSIQNSIYIPIMQALAAGTLLYVTVSEVLPRERARWHQREKRMAGLFQFIAFTLGFVLMYFLNFYFDH